MAAPPAALTDKEAEVYDRQIRLWGVEAQARMRAARVLVAGLSAVGAEVVKNIVLAGVNVALADGEPVQPRDLGAQFFLTAADVGRNRAEASLPRVADLNPLATVEALPTAAAALSDEQLAGFRVVVLCDAPPAATVALCTRCRALGVPVIAAGSFGWVAAYFEDAGAAHSYVPTVAGKAGGTGGGCSSAEATSVAHMALGAAAGVDGFRTLRPKFTQPAAYAWLALHSAAREGALTDATPAGEAAAAVEAEARRLCAAAGLPAEPPCVDAAAIAALVNHRGVEASPVAAVLGGLVGNEVVKLVTGKDRPVGGLVLFDGMGGGGARVYALQPQQ